MRFVYWRPAARCSACSDQARARRGAGAQGRGGAAGELRAGRFLIPDLPRWYPGLALVSSFNTRCSYS